MPEKQLQIHNTTRDPRTRITRAQSPARSRVMLLLGGGTLRVMRSRPVIVHESVVRRMLAELIEKEKAGHVKVTTMQGERISLSTLKPLEKAPAPPKQPVVKPDTAASDKGQGIPFVQHRDIKAVPPGVKVPLPEVGERAIPDGEDEVPRAPEPPAPPPPAEPPVPALVQQVKEEPPEEPAEAPPPEEPDVADTEPPPPFEPEPPEPSAPEQSRPENRKKSRKSRRR